MPATAPAAERRAAARAAQQAGRALHTYTRRFPIGQPDAWRYQGRYAWQIGHPAQAQRAWQRSRRVAAHLRMPYEWAQAAYEIGRHLPDGDPRRAAHLTRAQTVFARLDTPTEWAPVAEALGQDSSTG